MTILKIVITAYILGGFACSALVATNGAITNKRGDIVTGWRWFALLLAVYVLWLPLLLFGTTTRRSNGH